MVAKVDISPSDASCYFILFVTDGAEAGGLEKYYYFSDTEIWLLPFT